MIYLFINVVAAFASALIFLIEAVRLARLKRYMWSVISVCTASCLCVFAVGYSLMIIDIKEYGNIPATVFRPIFGLFMILPTFNVIRIWIERRVARKIVQEL